jgi:hypothetical protein
LWYRPANSNSEADALPETDVREVWFAGCHSGAFWRSGLPGVVIEFDDEQMLAEAQRWTKKNILSLTFHFGG